MERITTLAATGLLGASAIASFGNSGHVSEKVREIKNLEKALLTIATGQYLVALYVKDRKRIQRWRYLDWLITTPLLLKTFHSLAEEKGYKESFVPVLIFDILMVHSGYYSEFVAKTETEKNVAYLLGMISLAVIFFYINRWEKFLQDQGFDTKHISTFFYVGWTAYGLNFLNPNPALRQITFNTLDVVNKAGYALHLNNVLKTL